MRSKNYDVSMWQVVLLAVGSSSLLIIAANLDPVKQSILTLCIAAAGCILGVCSLVGLALFVMHSVTQGRKEWNEGSRYGDIKLTEAESRKIELLRSCSPEQLQAMGELRARITVTPDPEGVDDSDVDVHLDDESVKLKYIRVFVDGCTRVSLCPVGDYSEGSNEQIAIKTITNYLVKHRLAMPARGNQPAKFVDRDAAMIAIGSRPARAGAPLPAPRGPNSDLPGFYAFSSQGTK
jgi:hypothetical protein